MSSSLSSRLLCLRCNTLLKFLHKIWAIQVAFLFLLSVGCFCSSWLYVILLRFLHDRSNRPRVSFSSTTFKNIPVISDLFFEVSKFQYFINLFLKFKSNLLMKIVFFLLGVSFGFNFTCASGIICYHATQIAEIFHILQLVLVDHDFYWRWLYWDVPFLTFFFFSSHTHFHCISSSDFS